MSLKNLLVLWALTSVLFGLSAGTAAGRGALQISIISDREIGFQAGKGIDSARKIRNDSARERQELILTRVANSSDWESVSFTLIPRSTGMVRIVIQAVPGSRGINPWLLVDSVSVTGAELRNGSFEQLSEEGAPVGWGGEKENVVVGVSGTHSGRNHARVKFASPVEQSLILTRQQNAVVTLFMRPESFDGALFPADTNAVSDSGGAVAVSRGRMELHPTFENCGFYLNRKPEERGRRMKVRAFFREAGASGWQSAMPPAELPAEHAWRGSLFHLKENTVYELEVEISGEVNEKLRYAFRTRDAEVRVVKNISLDSRDFDGPVILTESGTPDGFVRYTMMGNTALTGKKHGEAVVVAKDLRYVILDRLKIDAKGDREGIRLFNCSDVIVRNCEVSGFSYAGVNMAYSGNVLMERCLILNPSRHAVAGILTDRARGNVVIRYNDIIGRGLNGFRAAIGSRNPTMLDGGLARDADVYGNLLAFADLSALESGGGGMNIRAYLNRFEGSPQGSDTGSCRLGPVYLYRNLYRNISRLPFRNGSRTHGDGAVYYINNTVEAIFPPSGPVCDAFHPEATPGEKTPLKGFWRNNLIRMGTGKAFPEFMTKWNCDIDHEMLWFPSEEAAAENRKWFERFQHGANNIYARPAYVDASRGDFRLRPECNGRNGAVRLPNLNFSHIGAFQDDRILSLPFRPVSMETDCRELHFSPNGSGSMEFVIHPGTLPAPMKFSVKSGGDFFSVEPADGVLRSGKNETVSVTLRPEKMKTPGIYRGMVVVRLPDGFSRCVSVYADRRK